MIIRKTNSYKNDKTPITIGVFCSEDGSRNIIRQQLRKELTELFIEQFTKEVRNFPVMDYEKRMRLLIGILSYVLPKANLPPEESEIQNLIYEKIYPEFRKLTTYLNVIPMDKKATILLSFVKLHRHSKTTLQLPLIKGSLNHRWVGQAQKKRFTKMQTSFLYLSMLMS